MMRVILLAAAGLQLAAGQPRPQFEVASVKASAAPGRRTRTVANGTLTAHNETLSSLIVWAYDVAGFQVTGVDVSRFGTYDIWAKAATPVPEAETKLMLQSLLAERFQLVIHQEQKQLHVYAMTVGKNGPRLEPSQAESHEWKTDPQGRGILKGTTMGELATILSGASPMKTIDMTGLPGRFDIVLDYSRYLDPVASKTMDSLADAMREAAEHPLGLQFRESKAPVNTIVIDSVRPLPIDN